VGYPEAETETGLLKTLVPSLPEAIGERMVAVANEVTAVADLKRALFGVAEALLIGAAA